MTRRPHRRPATARPHDAAVTGIRNPPASATATPRIGGIDALRGLALVAMIAYHFSFDLAHFGVTAWNFYRDPFWLHARTLILSSFLVLAGVSLVLAHRAGMPPRHFWNHVARIAGGALLVTLATWFVFPRSFIWFGVLHAIAVSLVLARPLVRRPWLALAIGAAVIVAGNVFAAAAFDASALSWIGFATHRPPTEDYVPLFPWAGVIFVGIALGHALVATRFTAVASLARAPRTLRWLGRHSLAVYMLHQPILFAIAWAIATAANLE